MLRYLILFYLLFGMLSGSSVSCAQVTDEFLFNADVNVSKNVDVGGSTGDIRDIDSVDSDNIGDKKNILKERKDQYETYLAVVNDRYITQYLVDQYKKLYHLLFRMKITDKRALHDLIKQYLCFDNVEKQGMSVTKAQLNGAIEIFAQSNNQTVEDIWQLVQTMKVSDVFMDTIKYQFVQEVYKGQVAVINDTDEKLFSMKEDGSVGYDSALYTLKDVDLNDLYQEDYADLIKLQKYKKTLESVFEYWRNSSYVA